MTKSEVASLAFKLMGIYAFFWAMELLFPFIGALVGLFFQILRVNNNQDLLNNLTQFACMLFPIIILVVAGRYLWRHSSRLGNSVFNSDAIEPRVVAINRQDALAIALAFAGFVMVIHVIPFIGETIVKLWNLWQANLQGAQDNIYRRGADPLHYAEASAGLKWTIVGMVLRLVIGIMVFLKAKAISLWWDQDTNPHPATI